MRIFPISLVLLLAWGALAVGGSPSWAAAPVVVFGVTTGILGFLEWRQSTSTPNSTSKIPHRPVILALCLFLAAVGLQLTPLSASVVTRFSPAHGVAEFERLLATADRRDPEFVTKVADGAPRPLSIAPFRTLIGLSFVAALSLLLVGASYGLSAVGVRGITRMMIVLGVVVAFLGIYQATSGTAVMYGIYTSYSPTKSVPFANRNHQAGWLVMVLSLALGSFAGEVARGMRVVAPRWRDRVIWFSTKQANVAILLLFASLITAIAVLTTQSRSGAASLLLALTVLVLWSGRRQPSKVRRRVMTMGPIAVALIAVATSGSAVMSRIAVTSWARMDGRVGVWEDSLRTLSDFWLTGTGFNTYGTAMLHYQTVADGFSYIEAHNDYLQFAVEGGLLVGIPALILIATLVTQIRRRFREGVDDTRTYWVRVGAVTGLVGLAFQSMVEFTLQMPGAAVMFATLLAIAIHHPRPRFAEAERQDA